MDDDTVHRFVCAADTYFGLTGIINEQTRRKFGSLLLIEDVVNWYNTRNYASKAILGTLKSDFLFLFKPVDYNKLNHEALD